MEKINFESYLTSNPKLTQIEYKLKYKDRGNLCDFGTQNTKNTNH